MVNLEVSGPGGIRCVWDEGVKREQGRGVQSSSDLGQSRPFLGIQ